MSFGCPVCNGLQPLTQTCPSCSRSMSDGGRADDYLGPYSPYRPSDAETLSNMSLASAPSTCVHQLYCGSCGYSASVEVTEWRM